MSIYNRGNIRVDRDFARFGSKSYAINKINTVDVRRQPPRRGWGYVALAFAVLLFLGNSAPGNRNSTVSIIALVLFVISLAIFLTAKASYRLFLMTSSNAVQAYESKDEGEVIELRDAIEGAMVGR
ncbi:MULTISPECIES: DUF6232 family protein [Sphingomonas]|uniref:DUF6232 family protein n=1 Tax=Sphingomonas TaxID=13687 RepID=UPI000DEF498E|nr:MULTISPECIES: DUF6232 family protein [Sphingomonas]